MGLRPSVKTNVCLMPLDKTKVGLRPLDKTKVGLNAPRQNKDGPKAQDDTRMSLMLLDPTKKNSKHQTKMSY